MMLDVVFGGNFIGPHSCRIRLHSRQFFSMSLLNFAAPQILPLHHRNSLASTFITFLGICFRRAPNFPLSIAEGEIWCAFMFHPLSISETSTPSPTTTNELSVHYTPVARDNPSRQAIVLLWVVTTSCTPVIRSSILTTSCTPVRPVLLYSSAFLQEHCNSETKLRKSFGGMRQQKSLGGGPRLAPR